MNVSAIAKQIGCSRATVTKYLPKEETNDEDAEDRPEGIAFKPNTREQAIRAQIEREAQDSEQAQDKKSLFAWIKSSGRDKGKDTKGRPLTDKEAQELRPALLSALLDYFLYMDELIYATNKKHLHVAIWSSIDEEEAGLLVDVWLARATRSATAARQVIGAVNRHAELKVGLILVPRFYQTFRAYVDGGGIGIR